MIDMLKTGLFLFVTCALAAICLAFTEQVTGPRIKEFRRQEIAQAKKQVLSSAVQFREIEIPAGQEATKSVSIGFNEKNEQVGTVVITSPKGYGGPINLVIGIDKEAKLTGVKIQSLNETPGLGTKLKDKFLDDFLKVASEKGALLKAKVKKDGGDVDSITAATVSSRAFCRGIQEAMDLVKKNQPLLQGITPDPLSVPVTTPVPGASK